MPDTEPQGVAPQPEASKPPDGPRRGRHAKPSTFDRRRFLKGAAAGLGAAAVAVAVGEVVAHGATGNGSAAPAARAARLRVPAHARHHPEAPALYDATLASGVTVPVARWLVEENARPGTADWVVTGLQTPHALEGFASQVSAVPGDTVQLFVNTVANTVQVQVYRMGYYQGLGGRLIVQTDTVPGRQQPPPVVTPGVNTVTCPWEPTMELAVDDQWPPGVYLLKLVGDGGQQQYIPLTVRDDHSSAAFVLQNSVTTWQAYNLWGGYSLYYGQTPGGGQDFANRARIVSFDRPYPKTWAQGAADLLGNEFPLLFDLERHGIDLTYWTDVDLHANPQRLAVHRCLFSMGHDEYWSTPMRQGAQDALVLGTNLAFLGANACYRQIRMQPSPVGPNRLQVCYKDASEDPMADENPALTTVDWNEWPVNDPESTMIGSTYQSVGANDPLIVTDASAWLWDGCGLSDGDQLATVVQGEYDRYVPALPGPANLDVFAHSPVAGQGNWSDITYYTVPGGGGVLASGMASFVFKLSNTTAFPWNVVPMAIPGVTDVLLRAMENVYGLFGSGPASATVPSGSNWDAVYQGAAAAAASAQGTTAA